MRDVNKKARARKRARQEVERALALCPTPVIPGPRILGPAPEVVELDRLDDELHRSGPLPPLRSEIERVHTALWVGVEERRVCLVEAIRGDELRREIGVEVNEVQILLALTMRPLAYWAARACPLGIARNLTAKAEILRLLGEYRRAEALFDAARAVLAGRSVPADADEVRVLRHRAIRLRHRVLLATGRCTAADGIEELEEIGERARDPLLRGFLRKETAQELAAHFAEVGPLARARTWLVAAKEYAASMNPFDRLGPLRVEMRLVDKPAQASVRSEYAAGAEAFRSAFHQRVSDEFGSPPRGGGWKQGFWIAACDCLPARYRSVSD